MRGLIERDGICVSSSSGLTGAGRTSGKLFIDVNEDMRPHALGGGITITDGVVRISRAAASVEYPCEFMLVAAMNPGPCRAKNPQQQHSRIAARCRLTRDPARNVPPVLPETRLALARRSEGSYNSASSVVSGHGWPFGGALIP